ncbi:hypothetical protein ACROYT_G028739 [Oculina patagonica]
MQQASQEETTGTTDEDILSLTSDKLQELYESTRNQCEDDYGIVPESHVVEEDIDPCQVDRPDSEGEQEDPEQPVGTVDDEAPSNQVLQQEFKASQYRTHSSCDNLSQYHGCYNLFCSPIAILHLFQYHHSHCILCLCGVTSRRLEINLRRKDLICIEGPV